MTGFGRSGVRRRLAAGVAVAATLVATACGAGGDSGGGGDPSEEAGQASDVGVTADSVRIGAHFPLTGVAAPGYSEIPTGAQAYFDFVNAAGGVDGRRIDYVFRDDGYNPTNTSSVVNELVLQEQVFALVGGLGTPTHSAVLDFLNGEGVPDLFVSSGSRLWNNPTENPETFGWQPDYEIEGKIIGQYIAENFPQARVGLFLQDDDFGEDGEAGARQFLGDQIVAAERYTPGNTDVVPQIAALQAAGADFIIGFNVPSYTALSQLVSLRLNYRPQWFYSNVGSDPTLVGALLARFSEGAVTGAGPLEGTYTTEYMPGVDAADDPWTQLWQRVWEASGAEGELTNYRIYGMAQAYTFIQALQAAGPNPTRDGITSALQEAGGSFEGPGYAPFRYASDSHAGLSGVRVVQQSGGVGTDLTPLLVTSNGDAEITEDAEEHAPPPESGIPAIEPVG